MTKFDIIQTKRLLLRRWRDADREPFGELNGDPETLVFFPSTLTRSESDAFADRIEARFEAHGYGLWALEVKQTGQFIGFTGLAPMQEDVPAPAAPRSAGGWPGTPGTGATRPRRRSPPATWPSPGRA